MLQQAIEENEAAEQQRIEQGDGKNSRKRDWLRDTIKTDDPEYLFTKEHIENVRKVAENIRKQNPLRDKDYSTVVTTHRDTDWIYNIPEVKELVDDGKMSVEEIAEEVADASALHFRRSKKIVIFADSTKSSKRISRLVLHEYGHAWLTTLDSSTYTIITQDFWARANTSTDYTDLIDRVKKSYSKDVQPEELLVDALSRVVTQGELELMEKNTSNYGKQLIDDYYDYIGHTREDFVDRQEDKATINGTRKNQTSNNETQGRSGLRGVGFPGMGDSRPLDREGETTKSNRLVEDKNPRMRKESPEISQLREIDKMYEDGEDENGKVFNAETMQLEDAPESWKESYNDGKGKNSRKKDEYDDIDEPGVHLANGIRMYRDEYKGVGSALMTQANTLLKMDANKKELVKKILLFGDYAYLWSSEDGLSFFVEKRLAISPRNRKKIFDYLETYGTDPDTETIINAIKRFGDRRRDYRNYLDALKRAGARNHGKLGGKSLGQRRTNTNGAGGDVQVERDTSNNKINGKNSRKGADLYRDKEEYKEGQVLDIKGNLDGYTVEGMTMPYNHPETLLEAWRNKHPNYYAFLSDDGRGIEVYPVEGGKTRLEALYSKARTSKQRQQYAERKARQMRERAESTAKPLGVKVNIIEPGTETDADRLKSKGWYDTKTGEILSRIVPSADLRLV